MNILKNNYYLLYQKKDRHTDYAEFFNLKIVFIKLFQMTVPDLL